MEPFHEPILQLVLGWMRGSLDFLQWFDQRIDGEKAVIAAAVLLAALWVHSLGGLSRRAAYVLMAVSAVLAGIAVYQGNHRVIYGLTPFRAELPPEFRRVHGSDTDIVAHDDAEQNSVELRSGEAPGIAPARWLAAHCIAADPDWERQRSIEHAFIENLAARDGVDVYSVVLLRAHVAPRGGTPDGCQFTWEDGTHGVRHYEVFVAIPDGHGVRYAHLHAMSRKPTLVLIAPDFETMRRSLFDSAGVPPAPPASGRPSRPAGSSGTAALTARSGRS
jgi:hypothetical protein